jgi:putative flippase GtrA
VRSLRMMLEGALERFRGRAGRPLRFVIAGAMNTVLGVGLYPALVWSFDVFRDHYLLALGICQAICLVFAFGVQKYAVFQSRGNMAAEFSKFATYYLANYAANWAILPLLVEVGKIDPVVSQLAFTLVVVVGSYFWHSRVTFKDAE